MVSLQIAHNSKRYCESCIFRNINKVIERLNFNNIFSIGHLYWAGQSMNSLPSQILERCRQLKLMDIFFTNRHTYTVDNSIEHVRADIQSITESRWSDFSNNITGRFNDDGSFTLTNKWSLANFKWIERSPAYLSGTLTTSGNQTTINTTLRPNSLIVFFFYLLAILFLCELFGINTFLEGPKILKLLLFPVFNLLLYNLMQMFTSGLRIRFERHLNL